MRTKVLFGLASAVVLLAAACGSGAQPPSAGTPATPVATPTASPTAAPTASGAKAAKSIDPRKGGLEVGFGEFAITLEAKAIRPGPVTFVVHNGGKLVHGFEIEALHELRAPEGAETHAYYDFVSADWARRWPAEEIWVARKRSD